VVDPSVNNINPPTAKCSYSGMPGPLCYFCKHPYPYY
jgi:hypothetical protein